MLVEGVSVDIVSDIATNIIREPLIEFTQTTCKRYNIPLESDVVSGSIWNPQKHAWESRFVELPVTDAGKLLLVPKIIARINMDYDVEKYFRNFMLEHLKGVEEDANTALVHTIKSTGEKRVYKTELMEKYGSGKKAAIEQTIAHPEVLARYKSHLKQPSPPLSHLQIAEVEGTDLPDWDQLLSAVIRLPVGNDAATEYEKAIEALLSAIIYPVLSNPVAQSKIHDGRKRIDIRYTNIATRGFFEWLGRHYCAPYVYVECKNFGNEVGNPELDQLSSRFSPSRGQFGILMCRRFENKALFEERCRDTARDTRGYVIALDDVDLEDIVTARKRQGDDFFDLPVIREKFERLVM